jgi:hypothetical protein
MNFSDKFKKIYWLTILVILTGLCVWRLIVGSFLSFDIYLFLTWFIIVLFPIISEISIFGVNVKKDIESVKNDLKSYINQIQNNNKTYINVNATTANPKEYKQKIEQETQETDSINPEEKQENSFIVSEDTGPNDTMKNHQKSRERFEKVVAVEKLVTAFLTNKYGSDYHTQIKFEDPITKNKIIFDGVIYKDAQIEKAVEIKYITDKSFDRFYYIAANFINKFTRIGLKVPILFIVVSDSLNVERAADINTGIKKLNSNKQLNPGLIPISVIFFAISESGLTPINF